MKCETAAFGVKNRDLGRMHFVEETFQDDKGNSVTIYIDSRNKKVYIPKQFSKNVKPDKDTLWRFSEMDSMEKLSAVIRLQLSGVRGDTINRICRDISFRYGID